MKRLFALLAAVCLLTTAAAAEYRITADRYVVDSQYDFVVQIEGSDSKLTLTRKFFASLLGSLIGDPASVTIVELPDTGVMTFGGDNVVVLDTFKLSPFKRLTVTPEANKTSTFTFIATDKDGLSSPLCRLTVTPPKTAGAPTAFDLNIETAKGLKVSGRFGAVDPDGESLAYEVQSAPSKGDLVCSGSTFVYYPHQGETGADSFTYLARDSSGNYSKVSSVEVRIRSTKGGFLYDDMEESVNHYAALRLADLGIMRGAQVAGRNFFSPAEPVSRGEYLAMLMQAAGIDTDIPTISTTGLAEDEEIPLWMKSYISTALAAGIVSGYESENGPSFDAATAITRAEAAVMTANVLGLEAASEVFGDAPTWAAGAMAAMSEAGLMAEGLSGTPLCRDEAAGILWGVVQSME
ncbi:MAG TPA: Ig-like domain-containing protein [Terriglobales bacterium]|nr:Ig-like domain-containing protein [Terriglobales bacterium]